MGRSEPRPLAAPVIVVCTATAITSLGLLLSLGIPLTLMSVLLCLFVTTGLAVVLKSFHEQSDASIRKEVLVVSLGVFGGVGFSALLLV